MITDVSSNAGLIQTSFNLARDLRLRSSRITYTISSSKRPIIWNRIGTANSISNRISKLCRSLFFLGGGRSPQTSEIPLRIFSHAHVYNSIKNYPVISVIKCAAVIQV